MTKPDSVLDMRNHEMRELTSVTDSQPQIESEATPLFDIVPTALVIVDSNCQISAWNVGMEELTGHLAKDVMQHSLKEILPELAMYLDNLHIMQQDSCFKRRIETEIQRQDGCIIPIGFSISRLKSTGFVPNGVIIIASDISEQRRSEELLKALTRAGRKAALARTAEQAFSALSNELKALGIWSLVFKLENAGKDLALDHIDPQSVLEDADDVSQYKKEWLSKMLRQFSIPAEKATHFMEMCRTGQPVFVEKFFSSVPLTLNAHLNNMLREKHPLARGDDVIMAPLWQDGEIVGDLLVGGAVRVEDQATIGAFAIHLAAALANAEMWEEMEEQIIQRTDKLYQERARLDAILKSMTDAVFFTDADKRIQYVNPAWEKLNGYTLEEALGKKSGFVLNRNDTSEVIQHTIALAAIEGKYSEGEIINRRKDGSTYEAYLTVMPVRNEKAEVEHFVGVLRDISNEKRLARAQEKFIAQMSHNLRTPLSNIQLYLSLLQKENPPEVHERYLETIGRESKRLHRLIEDLLSASRHDHGWVHFAPELIDINDFLQHIIEDRRELAIKDGIKLEFIPTQDLPHINADPSALEQVAETLLANAIAYSKSGSTVIIRSCRQVYGRQEWVGFSVSDSGYGITHEELPLIFDRFFRGSASHISNAQGTGLGLSLSKQLIDQHGGRIDVESTPNKGSTFTVWLKEEPNNE